MSLDDEGFYVLGVYQIGGTTIIESDGTDLLLSVPHFGTHEERSKMFVRFRNKRDAERAASLLQTAFDSTDIAAALYPALVAVADPDLAEMDSGVEIFGDKQYLPTPIQLRMILTKNIRTLDSSNVVLDTLKMTKNITEPARLSDFEDAFVQPEMYDDTHSSLFSVMNKRGKISIVNRNGMTWRNAVLSILRHGGLGCKSPALAEQMLPTFSFHSLRASFVPTTPVIKAKKQRRGTAPTTEDTRGRYANLLAAVGGTEAQYPLPALNKDAVALVKKLGQLYYDMKNNDVLPATEAQLTFARSLAKQNKMEFPEALSASRKLASTFIQSMLDIKNSHSEQSRQINLNSFDPLTLTRQ